jgi:hypothetical protein
MRTKAIRGLLAATMAASTVAVVGVGASSPASAASCSTWQYKVTSKTGGWESTLYRLTPKYTLWSGYYVNAHSPEDVPVRVTDPDGTEHVSLMKMGQVYNADKERLFGGEQLYVRKDKLDYVTCW